MLNMKAARQQEQSWHSKGCTWINEYIAATEGHMHGHSVRT